MPTTMRVTSRQRIRFNFLFDTLLSGVAEVHSFLKLLLLDLEGGIFPSSQTDYPYHPIDIIGPFPPSPLVDPHRSAFDPSPPIIDSSDPFSDPLLIIRSYDQSQYVITIT